MSKKIQIFLISASFLFLVSIPVVSFAASIDKVENTLDTITVSLSGLTIDKSYRINIFNSNNTLNTDKDDVLVRNWDIKPTTSTIKSTSPAGDKFAFGKYIVKLSDGVSYVASISFDIKDSTLKTLTLTWKGNTSDIAGSMISIYDGRTCEFEGEGWVCTVSDLENNKTYILKKFDTENTKDQMINGWAGCDSSTKTECTIKMNKNKSVVVSVIKAVPITPKNPTPSPTKPNQNQNQNNNSGNSTPIDSGSGNLIPCGTSANPTPCGGSEGWNQLMTLINKVIRFIFVGLSLPIAAIAFAYAGFLLLTSGGEASKKTKAKNIFLNVAIGLVFIAGSWLIVSTILSTLGYGNAGSFGF